MSIKILGGLLKGFNLPVYEKVTRPTGVLLKRKVFDARQSLLGFDFVDLCAGSGSVGFEALSRGANSLILVEKNSAAARMLTDSKNKIEDKMKKFNTSCDISISNNSVSKWLDKNLNVLSLERTILFFDPPYDQSKLYCEVINRVFSLTSFRGEFWIEYDSKGDNDISKIIQEKRTLHSCKSYTHGGHEICIFDFSNS